MKIYALTLLLSIHICTSARHKLSLTKHAILDVDTAASTVRGGPDTDFSQLLAEAGNTCDGDFLTKFSSPADDGRRVLNFDWKAVTQSMETFISKKSLEIKTLNKEVEEAARKLKEARQKVEVRPALPDEHKIETMIATVCDSQFDEWDSAADDEGEKTNGIESCKATSCGLMCDAPQCPDMDTMYDLKQFTNDFGRRFGDKVLRVFDVATDFMAQCEAVFKEEVDERKFEGYNYETSWCSTICNNLVTLVNEMSDDAGVATREELNREIAFYQDEFNQKTNQLQKANNAQAQCKKLKENMGEFVGVMTNMKKTFDEREEKVREIQYKALRAKKSLGKLRKDEEKAAGKEREAKKALDDLVDIEDGLKEDIVKVEELEAELEKQLIDENEWTEDAENDLIALELAQQSFTLFKSRLSYSIMKMYLLYELTILQPLERFVMSSQELQKVFADPMEILSGQPDLDEGDKGSQITMIDEIAKLLVEMGTKCEDTWLPAFKKIKLVNYQLTLPSVGEGELNMTKLSEETKEIMADMPESVKDILFPDGFLSTPGPEGLPDLCQSPEIDAVETTIEQVQEKVESIRQDVIEAFVKILEVSTDAIEAQATVTNIEGVDYDIHDCEHEPEGLRKFALIFGSIDFYKNYLSLWGHTKNGELNYFLLLEAQLSYLYIIAEEHQAQHKGKAEELKKQIEDVQKKREDLIAELEEAKLRTEEGSKEYEAIAAELEAAKETHDKRKKLIKQLEDDLDAANALVEETITEAAGTHKEAMTGAKSSSLIYLFIKGKQRAERILSEERKRSQASVSDHSNERMWRRKALQLRAEIEKIKKEAIFLPRF